VRKFLRKVELGLTKLLAAIWYITFILASIGALVWSAKWMLKVVGVM
jgi:hypothetical protein